MTIHSIVNRGFRKADSLLHKVFGEYVCSTGYRGPDGQIVPRIEKEARVHLHWQNLNDDADGEVRGAPYEGRFWLRIHLDGRRRQPSICFSWNLRSKHYLALLDATVSGHGGGDHDLSLGATLRPVSFHLSFENLFPESFRKKWKELYHYDDREVRVSLSFDDHAIVGGLSANWSFWNNSMEWSSKTPKWRHGNFDILDFLLGGHEREERTLHEQPTKIPMPEGAYDADLKLYEVSHWRKRWPFKKIMRSASVDIDIGIPHQGKGENDYDCGEDALYGLSCPANSVPEAVAAVVETVLRDRLKYDRNMLATYAAPELRKVRVEALRAERSHKDNGATEAR